MKRSLILLLALFVVCGVGYGVEPDRVTSLIEWFFVPRGLEIRFTPNREQVRPLVDHPLRDPSICKGPDGWYYLTGTDGTPILPEYGPVDFTNNDGIRVWKSRDLRNWELVGKVFDIGLSVMKHPEDTPGFFHGWRRRPVAAPGVPEGTLVRGVQAPEIHYFKDTFWIVYSISGAGGGLLKSTSGKAEGPYEDWAVLGEKGGLGKGVSRLFLRGGSPSLFADDDGAVYVLYHHGYIARMKDDLTGLAEPPRLLVCANPQKTGDKAMDFPLQVGTDGYFLKKIKGTYFLFATDQTTRAGELVQDVYVAWADNVYGPYSERRWCIPHAGQTTVFDGLDGELLATYCGNDPHAAFRDRPGLVPLGWTKHDHLMTFLPEREFPRKLLRVNTERYPWHRLPAISQYMMRDVQACRGPDGAIYYTGSFVEKRSGGKLFIYKSLDMVNWEEIEVWDWDKQKKLFTEPFADPREHPNNNVFSYMDTEIWYLNKTFYIGYAVYGSKPGHYLLRSTTGRAEGPYEPVPGDHWSQVSFFQDDDGKIYYGANNMNVPWKADMTGPADPKTQFRVWSADGSSNLGDCSGQLAKILGLYVHFTTSEDGFSHVFGSQSDPGCYGWNYMTASRVDGPWSREQVVGPHTGHGGSVQDRFGNWWTCVFGCEGSQAMPCWGVQTASIAPCEARLENGRLVLRLADKFPDYVEKALQEKEVKEKMSERRP